MSECVCYSFTRLTFLCIPYTGLGPFRALTVQSKLVRLGVYALL